MGVDLTMLASLAQTHREQLDTLASAWLTAGAKAVTIRDGERIIAQWPANHDDATRRNTEPSIKPNTQSEMGAPIADPSGLALGELCVEGRVPAAAVRLAADAALIGAMAGSAGELDSVVEALAETEDQLLALYELTRPGPSRLNVDQILSSTARQAARLVKAAGAFVILNGNVAVQQPEAQVAPETLSSLFGRLRRAGHELLLARGDDVAHWPAHTDSLFLVPLYTDDQGAIAACLGLWLNRPAAALSPDLKLARSIAEQVGAQLEIALLHQKLVAQAKLEAELELARKVQLGLLPRRPPQVAGLDLYAASRPALQVGGDFYDFYVTRPNNGGTQHPARCAVFAVGDVTGKGISAALLMAMTRTALRVVASGLAAEPTPADILKRANADLYDDFTEVDMMASIFVGQYDAGSQLLTYANDGHSPVILCPRGEHARLLMADGPMVGVLPVSLAQNQSVPFAPGDVLAIMTDGFNEAADGSGEFFGIERLERLIEETAGLSASAIGQRLHAEVEQFSAGHAQEDDQTLIIVKGI